MKMFFGQSLSENVSYTRSLRTLSTALQCITGSVFLGLMSQFSVQLPFTPVPITLQTFALFLLILAQGKKKASYSVILYLMQATLGLPVLNGGLVNPAWMLSPTAGYLIGFLGCTYVGGYMLERKRNPGFGWTLFSLACGQSVLFLMGTAYLSYFVGLNNAFTLGVAPFLLGAVLKLCSASCASKPINSVAEYLSK